MQPIIQCLQFLQTVQKHFLMLSWNLLCFQFLSIAKDNCPLTVHPLEPSFLQAGQSQLSVFPHRRVAAVSQSYSWPFVRLFPVAPCLSWEAKTGHSTPGMAHQCQRAIITSFVLLAILCLTQPRIPLVFFAATKDFSLFCVEFLKERWQELE